MSKPNSLLKQSSKSFEERYYNLAASFTKACKVELSSSSKEGAKKEKDRSLQNLAEDFYKLGIAYQKTGKQLKGRVAALEKIKKEQAKAQKIFVALFYPRTGRLVTSKVQGIPNYGNDCAFNALLQIIFHVPFLRKTLLAIPEFTALRKAASLYFSGRGDEIDSHKMRQMLHSTFGDLIDPDAGFQDASEALELMLNKVSPNIAAAKFPLIQTIQTYEPTGKVKQIKGSVDRSRLDMNNSITTRARNQSIHIDAFPTRGSSDRKGKIKSKEADFDAMFGAALDVQGHRTGENGYFLGADLHLLYQYRPIRNKIVFDEMPHHLIITTRRFKADGNVNDTAMQMPRVLSIPQEALAHPTEDRRLVLKSFLVYRPGHYVAYVRRDNQWYLCDDDKIEPVTIQQVDKVLHHYAGGGSYVHFYEQGNADAEPLGIGHRGNPQATPEAEILEKLQKLAASDKGSNEELLKIFDQLPTKTKNAFYHQVWDKATKGAERRKRHIGETLLRKNVRVLFEQGILKPIIAKPVSKSAEDEPSKYLSLINLQAHL